MKKFLLATDFSVNAKHALDYGYSLAKQVKADIVICNAIITPAEVPQSGFVTWPIEESDLLEDDIRHELRRVKKHLNEREQSVGFNPSITCIEQAGTVVDVINSIAEQHHMDLVIIGTHGSGGLSTLLLGNHSREMIDGLKIPVLLIPPAAKISPIKRIAFAADFKNPKEDLKCIHKLITLARPLNAEILVTSIFDENQENPEKLMKIFYGTANYPLIRYLKVKENSPQAGLEWIAKQGGADVLAMVHRDHNFIDSLFNRSQTQKMAECIPIPLLVFRPGVN